MIDEILIHGPASYSQSAQRMYSLDKINFVFGANGAGKTTIGRLVAEAAKFPGCHMTWSGGLPMQTLVYNTDFVKNNFTSCEEVKGIFTLGEKNVEVIARIDAARADSERIVGEIESLQASLVGTDGDGGKRGQLTALDRGLETRCWDEKKRHEGTFGDVFTGLNKSKSSFKERVLKERCNNDAELTDLGTLIGAATTVFADAPTLETTLPILSGAVQEALDSNPILSKKIIGKADIAIAELITRLSSGDWVRSGKQYLQDSDGRCPFCQQAVPKTLERDLSDYFDQAFMDDSREVERFETAYRAGVEQCQAILNSVATLASDRMDAAEFAAQKKALEAQMALNLAGIADKRRELSRVVTIGSVDETIAAIGRLIENANAQIAAHNSRVNNLEAERMSLKQKVWKHIVEVELREVLDNYETERSALVKGIEGIERKLNDKKVSLAKCEADIRDLERSTTSIQPAIDEINRILRCFNLGGFSLERSGSGHCYRIVRPNKTNAADTLSEGEKTFVTFLYFFQLIKGSDSETGVSGARVVVFDDPVSSLGSDTLFAVAALLKSLMADVRQDIGSVKQLFVLTHNVYFHKEITYRTKGNCGKETFWTVRKPSTESIIERHADNPIKTTYELLWQELKRPDVSAAFLPNILRRILENYFTVLGNAHLDDIVDEFEGEEKIMCQAMISWSHDGSHSIFDDVSVTTGGPSCAQYLAVFERIFKTLKHGSHYSMMMGVPVIGIAAGSSIAHSIPRVV